MTRSTLRLILGLCLAALPAINTSAQSKPSPNHFFLGADISALDAPSRRPLPPYNENGKSSDELTILEHHGWTAYRLRVFVAPVHDAPDNTLENALPLARKIKASGAILILDLHFSDTWADPQHQEIPVAWRGMDIHALARQWQTHARDTVKAFKDAGAMPDIVQVGNEITVGAAWPLAQLHKPHTQPGDDAGQWKNLILLLKAGIRGVRQGSGHTQPRIAIHIDKGGRWETTEWFFDHLNAAHVTYDIIAQSFYPPGATARSTISRTT